MHLFSLNILPQLLLHKSSLNLVNSTSKYNEKFKEKLKPDCYQYIIYKSKLLMC